MENIFIKLIKDGTIGSLGELKDVFRKIAKKTHPDAVGSDELVEKFIEFKAFFDEARQFLKSNSLVFEEDQTYSVNECRLMFFHSLRKLDTLELPHNKNKKTSEDIKAEKEEMALYFKKWDEKHFELFENADFEYDLIKMEKPKNDLTNLRKPSLYMNLRPVFFNLCNYHITGLEFYKKHLMRNLDPIIKRLEEKKFFTLKNFLLFLIEDMEKGPAVFG
ncbi:MAG: hypothetical protein JXB50_00565 [Spirochaetes bacterium]|nr:hypothetical protein [Spirochaetota bacterium]